MSDTPMEKIPGFPEFEVTDFKQNDNDMGFCVVTKERSMVCHVCVCYKFNPIIYKSRKQTVRDITLCGSVVPLSSTDITMSAVDVLTNLWRAWARKNVLQSVCNYSLH